jgi:hypothetical protein
MPGRIQSIFSQLTKLPSATTDSDAQVGLGIRSSFTKPSLSGHFLYTGRCRQLILERVVQSRGLTIDRFYIPPFTVEKGDIVILELPNGPNFMEVLSRMVDLLTRKQEISNVTINADFVFVNHIVEKEWTRFFLPMTVGRFIKRNANPSDRNVNNVYDLCDLKPTTQIRRLPGNHRKILSMLTALSWTNNIIFDLAGVDPTGGKKAYNLAKENARSGGTVILLDNYDDFKNDCTKYIKYEMVSR